MRADRVRVARDARPSAWPTVRRCNGNVKAIRLYFARLLRLAYNDGILAGKLFAD
jgi:hypothetical protein